MNQKKVSHCLSPSSIPKLYRGKIRGHIIPFDLNFTSILPSDYITPHYICLMGVLRYTTIPLYYLMLPREPNHISETRTDPESVQKREGEGFRSNCLHTGATLHFLPTFRRCMKCSKGRGKFPHPTSHHLRCPPKNIKNIQC